MNRDAEQHEGAQLRLTAREWIAVIVVALACFAALPPSWKERESFTPGEGYRVPYALSQDYWFFQRYVEKARQANEVLVIGDSVVWGEYVPPGESLADCLNRLDPGESGERYGNLGVNGSHPLALEGLLRYFAGPLDGARVLLHLNPLWMSSPRHDLQLDAELQFNHPELVPQFTPRVPCYRAGLSERLGISLERHADILSWVSHLRIAYYGSRDLQRWTLENPLANPLRPLESALPSPLPRPRHHRASWLERGQLQDLPWVENGSSLQWQAFERTIDDLRSRGCDVFVLVGPFNEHLLEPPSLERYRDVKRRCLARLVEARVPSLSPEALPTELYADASHPLAEGYALLAEQLLADEAFRRWAM